MAFSGKIFFKPFTLFTLHMDFAATLEYILDMYEHTNDRFIIGMHVKKENLTAHKYFYYSKQLKVMSSHLYLYNAFNNTNCNKALHNIK